MSLTLCGNAGPLPEVYSQFINAKGDLQVGDAFGLEAQWIASMIIEQQQSSPYPESPWSMQQILVDEIGIGCVTCGDEVIETVNGLCVFCS